MIFQRDVGDILDRGSIAKLKAERIKAPESIKEWKAFEQGVSILKDRYKDIPIEKFFDLMVNINAMIWDLESDVRLKKLDGAINEVGLRAIAIREHNTLRVQIKNIVNMLTNTGFIDIKKDHVSE